MLTRRPSSLIGIFVAGVFERVVLLPGPPIPGLAGRRAEPNLTVGPTGSRCSRRCRATCRWRSKQAFCRTGQHDRFCGRLTSFISGGDAFDSDRVADVESASLPTVALEFDRIA